MVDSKLLKILACPDCKGSLQQTMSGKALVCTSCRQSFEIRQGIPVLLPKT